jgi:SPASM domain peptide maturase of grasp-with-spasm system
MTKGFFSLHSNCILVKGAKRSVVCDLFRNNIQPIPNDLYDLFENDKFLNLEHLFERFSNQDDKDVVSEYIDFLVKEDYGCYFKKDYSIFFTELNTEFKIPSLITNCIIDFKDCDSLYLKKVVDRILDLQIINVEFRFFCDKFDLNDLKMLYSVVNQTAFKHISLIIPYNKSYHLIDFEYITFRFNNIVIYASESDEIVENKNSILFYVKNLISIKSCGIVLSKYFSSNVQTFSESQHHNTCLNRKISIDKDGYIRNCPSMPQHFGNIKDTTLEEALEHPDFKKYWNVNKDMIAVCKDCEFRHVCTDCRAYTERTNFEGDLDLSKPLKCGYNPYTNEWAEWSTNPLKEKAIEYYGMQDFVKKDV